MYSGYISIGDGKYYFYWYANASNHGTAATDPSATFGNVLKLFKDLSDAIFPF